MSRAWPALLLLIPTVALAQETSVSPGSVLVGGGGHRAFAPAWSWFGYDDEQFAQSPRDTGECAVGTDRTLVYCGIKSGSVVALTAGNGARVWEFPTKGSVRSAPYPTADAVYTGSSDGCVYRLDARTGVPTWPAPYCTDAAVFGGPVLADGRVFFVVSTNKLYALDAATGTFLWEYHRDRPQFMSAEGSGAPAVDGNRVYAGFSDGTLVALDTATGREVWTAPLARETRGTHDADATPVVADGVVYASSFAAGPTAVRASDGEVLWRGTWFGASQPLVSGRNLVFGTAEGEVVGVRKDTGKAAFITKLRTSAASAPVRVGDVLVVAGDRGLWALRPADGAPVTLLSVPMGVVKPPAVDLRRVFFVGNGGTINAADVQPQ